jgi:hypothetical protein
MIFDINNIPKEIQEMFDRGVDMQEVSDCLDKYRNLKQIEKLANDKLVSRYIEIDWRYFHDDCQSSEEDIKTAERLDEMYGMDNLINLQYEYEDL